MVVKKKFRIIAILFLLMVLVGGLVGYKMYNQEHVDLSEESADYSVTPETIIKEFLENGEVADKKYLNKIIDLAIPQGSYQVNEVDSLTHSIILSGMENLGINITLSTVELNKIKDNSSITLRTEYKGFLPYDKDFGIPGQITFARAILINN